MLDEYLDFKVTADVLATAGGRALGSIISKHLRLNGLQYNTYFKLFSMCVCPILDYAAEVWGFGDFSNIDSIQNRTQRVFLGVHNFATNAAVMYAERLL